MVTIQEAQAGITQSRQLIAEKRTEAKEIQENLRKAKQSLPSRTSQQALRQKLSGLQGRKARRNIKKAQEKISARESLVTDYLGDIQKFEQEQIVPVERNIADIQARQSAIERVEKAAAEDKVWALAAYGEGYVRKYAQDWLEQRSLARESFSRDVAGIEATLPEGEKLVVDYKNMRISGIESAGLGQSLSVSDYNKQITNLNKDIGRMPELNSVIIDQSRLGLDKRDLKAVSDISKIKTKFSITGGSIFPLVSARGNKNLNNQNATNISGINNVLSGVSSGSDSDLQSGNFLSRITGRVVGGLKDLKEGYEKATSSKEIYSPRSGTFKLVSATGIQGTAIDRIPTQEEKRKIDLAQIKGDAIVRVPAQYLGTIFDKKINVELAERGAKGNFIERTGTFLNPKYQLDIAVSQEQLRKDSKNIKDLNKKIEKAQKDLSEGKITQERYNALVTNYQASPEVKRLSRPGVDALQAIAGSDLTGNQKTVLAGATRTVQTVPYFFAPTRAILGADIAIEGSQSFKDAETKGEKYLAAGQTALGVGLAVSGARGVLGGVGTGMKVTGTPGQLAALRGATYSSGILLGGSVGAVDYYSTLGRTGSKEVALGSALGTGGTIIGGTLGKDFVKDVGKLKVKTENLLFGENKGGTRFGVGIGGRQESVYAGEVVEVITKDGKVVRMSKADALRQGLKIVGSREAALGEFSRSSTQKQAEIIKSAFQKDPYGNTKVYFGNEELIKDIQKATRFMKESGLTNEQIKNVLTQVFPERFKVITPTVTSKGGVLNVNPTQNVLTTQPVIRPVTQTALQESIYAGKGTYELTNIVSPRLGSKQGSNLFSGLKKNFLTGSAILPVVSAKENTDTLSIQTPKVESRSMDLTKQFQPIRSLQASRSILALRQPQETKSEVDTKQTSDFKLDTKTDTKVSSKQILRNFIEQRTTKQKQPKEKTKFIKPTITTTQKTKEKVAKKTVNNLFKIYARKGGVDIEVGEAGTEKEAFGLLGKELKGTLRASGFVEKGGKKVRPITFGSEFRSSKVDPFRVVQRKERRLGTKRETQEIQLFNKPKRRSKNRGFF